METKPENKPAAVTQQVKKEPTTSNPSSTVETAKPKAVAKPKAAAKSKTKTAAKAKPKTKTAAKAKPKVKTAAPSPPVEQTVPSQEYSPRRVPLQNAGIDHRKVEDQRQAELQAQRDEHNRRT